MVLSLKKKKKKRKKKKLLKRSDSLGGTSESDLPGIGIGPYADTLCRLDGGTDHNIFELFPNVWRASKH